MDIKDFAKDFMEAVHLAVELESANKDEELTVSILDYMMDAGVVGAPEPFYFKKTGAALHAYDYNIESNSLDLFYLLPVENLLGKVNNNKVDDAFSRLWKIYNDSLSGAILKNAGDNDELHELVDLIQSTKGHIENLRFFVLTNGLIDSYNTSQVELEGDLLMTHDFWDMQRIFQQDRIRSGKEKIEIDLSAVYNTELPCLEVISDSSNVQGYLTSIPGVTLAKIYNQYRHALLEKNVRNFLQFRGKVNRGIRSTLLKDPEMFFSYNNGISTTASSIEVEERDGAKYITRLSDWQIVNGCQTTASIAATYKEKNVDISRVFVPMKISVIQDKKQSEEYVPKISEYANSQTGIKKSDYHANDDFLNDIQTMSRQTWIPNENSKLKSKWYFERTRGQYMDDLSSKHGVEKKRFQQDYPKVFKFDKEDVFKLIMDWDQRPEMSCQGPGKAFESFIKEIKKNSLNVSQLYYKRLVGKAILSKTIKKIVRNADFGGYKSNLLHYLMASVSFLSKKKLNLDDIWKNQEISQELNDFISKLAYFVWEHITTPKIANANINDWTRKSECWESLRIKLDAVDEIPHELCFNSDLEADDSTNLAQKKIIDQAWAINSSVWFDLSKWAKERNYLSPRERKMAYQLGILKSTNRIFSFKQAKAGLSLMEDSKELGFSEE